VILIYKKGFTLVELLAVIVVLSVIALIAVPITLNLIEESKKNSFKSSVSGMIQSIEIFSTKKVGSKVTLNLGEEDVIQKLDFSGKKPSAGMVYIDEDGIISIIMYSKKYCGYRKYGEENVTVLDIDSNSCPSPILQNENIQEKEQEIKNFLGVNS
jgi:prepilin-type N-terminal cleavage/methylation domain-containing protein